MVLGFKSGRGWYLVLKGGGRWYLVSKRDGGGTWFQKGREVVLGFKRGR